MQKCFCLFKGRSPQQKRISFLYMNLFSLGRGGGGCKGRSHHQKSIRVPGSGIRVHLLRMNSNTFKTKWSPLEVYSFTWMLRWMKISADDILKYIFILFSEIGLDISCKLSPKETICVKYPNLFPRGNINMPSAEFAQSGYI